MWPRRGGRCGPSGPRSRRTETSHAGKDCLRARPDPLRYFVMTGMEKREQVFVSSTYLDLVEERQEVIQTLLEADCIPSGMELFPASDDDRWSLIRRVIDDCDYYIVVIGGRYGSVDPDAGLSYTEMEFDYAVQVKKPVMGFVHGAPGSISADKSELSRPAQNKLAAFRAKVEQRIVKYWTSPQELGGQVAKSLIQIRKTHPAEGWVRAGRAITPEVERELIELRARVSELTAQLESEKSGHQLSSETFAQGDDVFQLPSYIHYEVKNEDPRTQYLPTKRFKKFVELDITWNELLYELGPLMMDEASEERLDEQLDTVAYELFSTNQKKLTPKNAINVYRVDVSSTVIHDVKVQFFSLNLIEKSTRRHPVNDTRTYWSLTRRGQEQLMRLRAVKHTAVDDSSGDPEEEANSEG
jgi:hypothetical protein